MPESIPDLTDAIAAANRLYNVATELRDEASNWAKQGCRDQLTTEADQLERIARATFRGLTNLDVADAYAIAGHHRLAQVRAVAHFLRETYRR